MARQPTPDPADQTKQAIDEAARTGERVANNVTSTAKAGLRAVADTTDQAAGKAREGMERLSAQAGDATRRTQQSMDAAAGAGGALMQGAQDISKAWMDLAQDRMQRMAEGMRALASCRTPADLIKVQNELMQEAMEQMVDTNRRVADVSMRVMQEVAGTVTAPLKRDPL